MMTRADCLACKSLYEKYQLYVYQLLAARITRLSGRSGGVIADIGTGPGYLAVELARVAEAQVRALDINEAMLELAADVVKQAGLGAQISLELGDVHSLPWSARSFDLVVSYTCMHHWLEPARALSECYRVLRPGGLMAIVDVRPVSPRTVSAFAELIPEPEYLAIIEKAYRETLSEPEAADFCAKAGISSAEISSLELTDDDIMDYLETGEPFEIPDTSVQIDEPTLWMMTARKSLG